MLNRKVKIFSSIKYLTDVDIFAARTEFDYRIIKQIYLISIYNNLLTSCSKKPVNFRQKETYAVFSTLNTSISSEADLEEEETVRSARRSVSAHPEKRISRVSKYSNSFDPFNNNHFC